MDLSELSNCAFEKSGHSMLIKSLSLMGGGVGAVTSLWY